MTKPRRFSAPGVLSPDFQPIPLEHFMDNLPSKEAIDAVEQVNRLLGVEKGMEWLHTPLRPVDLLLAHPDLVIVLLRGLERGAHTCA